MDILSVILKQLDITSTFSSDHRKHKKEQYNAQVKAFSLQ